MRAPTVDEIFEYPEHAEFHTKANIGYDFILISKALDEAPCKKFVQVFPTLARNPLGVIVASCAIEGYIHYVGHHIDRDWSAFTKWPKSVRTRIERIYSLLKKPVDFDSGVMHEVLQLAGMRNALAHPPFQEVRRNRPTPSNPVFERVDAEFPAGKSREIAENFRDTILRDSGMRDLWWEEGFVETPPATIPASTA
jgi:hypothetical protein